MSVCGEPVGLRAYVTVFLFREGRVLLMRRGQDRAFAPGRWTGVGGRVEPGEIPDLRAAALRELTEETGLRPDEVTDLRLRAVYTQPEGGQVVLLAFFSGETRQALLAPTDEGDLRWIPEACVWDLDLIGNARAALSAILQNVTGTDQAVWFGVCNPASGETLRELTVAPVPYPMVTARGVPPAEHPQMEMEQ